MFNYKLQSDSSYSAKLNLIRLIKKCKNKPDKYIKNMPINKCSYEPVIDEINDKGLVGFRNWRMPSTKQLQEILSPTIPMLNPTYFPEVEQYKEDFQKYLLNSKDWHQKHNNFDTTGYKVYENKSEFLPTFRKGIIIMVRDFANN